MAEERIITPQRLQRRRLRHRDNPDGPHPPPSRRGGRIVFFAVPDPGKEVVVPINDFWMNEITILTSYYCGPPDIDQAIKHIENGTVKVNALITHRLPLADITRGFQMVLDGTESVKVIINPNE